MPLISLTAQPEAVLTLLATRGAPTPATDTSGRASKSAAIRVWLGRTCSAWQQCVRASSNKAGAPIGTHMLFPNSRKRKKEPLPLSSALPHLV
jgi:hypothetical protein